MKITDRHLNMSGELWCELDFTLSLNLNLNRRFV
jgi:hypothetical protein